MLADHGWSGSGRQACRTFVLPKVLMGQRIACAKGALLIVFVSCLTPLFLTTAAQGVVALHGGGDVPFDGTNYSISEGLGALSLNGKNLFHSFSQFTIETNKIATFTGNAGIENVIARVTGGSRSDIYGQISCAIDGANLFLLNPAGITFGPNASLNVSGSFHASTADYLKFRNGEVFHANPANPSVFSSATPEAFGFLGSNPAAIISDAALQVQAGKTLSLVGGDLTITNDPNRETYWSFDGDGNIVGTGTTYYSLSAPGGAIHLASVASAGTVNISDLSMESISALGDISITSGANINVMSDTSGQAGTIMIRGGQMLIKDSGFDLSGAPSGSLDIRGDSLHADSAFFYVYNTSDNPAGAAVNLQLSQSLLMDNAATIDSSTIGGGQGGSITIQANTITLGNDEPGDVLANYGSYGHISSNSWGLGHGGDISISGTSLTVQNGFSVTTSLFDAGDGGNISVNVDTLRCLDQGVIGSNAYGSGTGGTVTVTANDILLSGANTMAVLNNEYNPRQLSGLNAEATGTSNGGKIIVNTDALTILGSFLFGSGHGADIEVTARKIAISGYYEVPEAPNYALSAIDGRVYGTDTIGGTGGNIAVTADTLTLENAGVIRTGLYADAPGNAGNITMNIAGKIEIKSLGQIYADSFRGTGNSGNIDITAQSMNITGTGGADPPAPLDLTFTGLSTTTDAGSGGTIALNLTGDLTMTADGGIKADTSGAGTGGSIDITAQNVVLTDSASINASSTGSGNAGDISITAANSLRMNDSFITTEASENSDGGNISITAPYMLYLSDSRITSSVGGDKETTGGNITIDPQFVILNNSQIIANAYEGTGGNITIIADTFLTDPLSVVSASSALGVSGTVDIRAPISNISGLLSPLSSDTVSASTLLRERCIARIRAGKYSSFVVGGRDGLPVEPGNLMPSLSF